MMVDIPIWIYDIHKYIIIVSNTMYGENLSFKLTMYRIKYEIKYIDRLFDFYNCKLLRYHLYIIEKNST